MTPADSQSARARMLRTCHYVAIGIVAILVVVLPATASALPAPSGATELVAEGTVDSAEWRSEQHGPDEVVVTPQGPGGQVDGQIRVQREAIAGGRPTRDGVGVSVEAWTPHVDSLRRLVGVAEAIGERHGGWAPRAPPASASWSWALGAWLAVLPVWAAARWSRSPVVFDFQRTHAVPAVVQLSIFAYWSMWWSDVAPHIPVIAAQLGFAYVVDGVLSLWIRRRWVVGFGPVPVVLSMGLFLWFGPLASAGVVLVAFASKALITRGGRHVLNPSAIGLTVVGILTSVSLGLGGYIPHFHTMNLPPFMAEFVLVAAVLPQLRLPIVLVTLGAFVGNTLAGPVGPGPALTRPATLLAFALLATDPATIPRTAGGRFLFGLAYGIGVRVCSIGLIQAGLPDDLSKVLPLPLCNVATAAFDVWAERLRFDRWLRPDHNFRYVALWFILAAATLWVEKPRTFEAALHWSLQTPGVTFGPDGLPYCPQNPGWCRAFGVPGGGASPQRAP